MESTVKEPKAPKKEGSKGKGKIQPAYIVIIVLAVALAGTLVYVLLPKPAATEPTQPQPVREAVEPGGRGTVVVAENVQQIIAARSSPPPAGHYITTMNNRWSFERWDAPSAEAYVANDERNEYTVYFDLMLTEDNSLLYSSPYIPPGGELRNFALSSELAAGEYAATVVYRLVDEDGAVLSNLSVGVTVTVLN